MRSKLGGGLKIWKTWKILKIWASVGSMIFQPGRSIRGRQGPDPALVGAATAAELVGADSERLLGAPEEVRAEARPGEVAANLVGGERPVGEDGGEDTCGLGESIAGPRVTVGGDQEIGRGVVRGAR